MTFVKHVFLFVLILNSYVYGQDTAKVSNLNALFELHIDSIQRQTTAYRNGNLPMHYLYYSIKNNSPDTLTFITNSCFYYNHYHLKIGEIEYELNPDGGCYMNSHDYHIIAPRKSFSHTEWISLVYADTTCISDSEVWTLIPIGQSDIWISIPLVKENSSTYRIDGRDVVENYGCLIFEGSIPISEIYVNKSERKKKVKKKKDKRV